MAPMELTFSLSGYIIVPVKSTNFVFLDLNACVTESPARVSFLI